MITVIEITETHLRLTVILNLHCFSLFSASFAVYVMKTEPGLNVSPGLWRGNT